MGFTDILKQYIQPGVPPSGDAFEHFDVVAHQATPKSVGEGIAAALRSTATPELGQTLSTLFSHSNPEQKAGVLNELMQTLGPLAAATAGSGLLGRLFGTTPSGPSNPIVPITPAQAAQVPPTEVTALASAAQQQDESVIDRLGTFYAAHPTLVKTLGVAAVAAVMSHMGQHT